MEIETTDLEQEVMRVLENWSNALRAKDLDALGRCYAEDVRVFDLGARMVGYDNLRALWESCLPYFPNPIGTERKDIQIMAVPGMAPVTFLSRLIGMESDHPSAKSWLRTTVCLRKVGDEWKIVHDHISLPVDCGAEKPTHIFD
jgi:ketosteroid isomerase-like protein